MERKRSNKRLVLLILLMTVFSISVTFWSVSSKLNISRVPEFNSRDWDINFLEFSLKSSVTGTTQIVRDPKLEGTYLTSFHVIFGQPGDSVIFSFDLENIGRIDALLLDLVRPDRPLCQGKGTAAFEDAKLICDNLIYTLTYADSGEFVKAGDLLNVGEKKELLLKLEYPKQVNRLPYNNVEITNLSIALVYIQKNM